MPGAGAVTYTHLDVYKRQRRDGDPQAQPLPLAPDRRPGVAHRNQKVPRADAVSYTHLLYNPGEKPNFLITEAMRGFGAILRLVISR